jgi:hypothetical protein
LKSPRRIHKLYALAQEAPEQGNCQVWKQRSLLPIYAANSRKKGKEEKVEEQKAEKVVGSIEDIRDLRVKTLLDIFMGQETY